MSLPSSRPCPSRRLGAFVPFLLLVLGGLALPVLAAPQEPGREYAQDEKVGVDEKLGETVPGDITFRDEEGQPVKLGDLLVRPTVLTLVYFRCPSICSPLMHEVAHTVDELSDEMVPGIDYDLVTVSFDDREGPDLARTAKSNLLGDMQTKVPPESWHFLTGDALQIMRLADAVGFRFKRDREDFVHAATVIFLTKEGKIVRYLGGLKLLPMDVQMAVLDAAEGRPRTLMQRIQQLCYAYDPEGKTYVFKINRIILAVTIFFVLAFLAYLLLRRRRQPAAVPVTDDRAPPPPEGTVR